MTEPKPLSSNHTVASHPVHELVPEMGRQLVGLDSLIERLLIALLCKGHILIEGPPGVAKTRTIKQFAMLIDTRFVRIQATPDLLPADITGGDIYHQPTAEFRFVAGPLFNNIVLVDEINRAPPKVQSALLEAMGEGQVSTTGTTRQLEELFLVAATQNPIEHEGTYPLPEAQLDRFMFFVHLDLPEMHNERLILDQVLSEQHLYEHVDAEPKIAVDAGDVLNARAAVRQVFISDAVRDYIVRLTGATRGQGMGAVASGDIAHAASPRASINLALAAQAKAWLAHRNFVEPADVAQLAPDVLSGRIVLDYRARAEGVTAREVIKQIVENTPQV